MHTLILRCYYNLTRSKHSSEFICGMMVYFFFNFAVGGGGKGVPKSRKIQIAIKIIKVKSEVC